MLEIIFYVMGIVLGVSLLAKLISAITVRRMVKEAAGIQKSNHKLMKLIKAKFEHASLISDRVQNVGAFVDKYLYEYKVFGFRLHTWQSLPKKALIIILILGVFSICESIRRDGFTEATVGYIQWTSIFVLLLLLVQFVTGEHARLQATRNYMVEYLENVCIHRYAKKHNVIETDEQEERQSTIEQPKEEELAKMTQGEAPKLQIVEKIGEEEERNQREMRIRAILEEFLA